ncbi:MAG: D-2-hydroxyacid dehydrogenase family protein [Bryobacteraceae bacterium]
MRVAIPDDAPPVMGPSAAWAEFQARHETVYFDSLPEGEEELAARIAGAEAVVNIRSSCRFTESLLEHAPAMKVLSIWGTGTDNVDLAAARARGIRVTNTPGVAAASIAEHCLGLTLAVARGLVAVDASVRRGEWQRGRSTDLAGKTLGVIGLGAIGRRFARLGEAIGMRVIAWTMNPSADRGFELVPLERLLRESDVVSLHLRLSEKTRGFLGAAEFAAMKSSAIFINTARGPIVDEAAMVSALREGRIAGAGLDVFETEPLPAGHPVTGLANVVLTPHCAGITPETVEAGLRLALENVEAWAAGRAQNVVA